MTKNFNFPGRVARHAFSGGDALQCVPTLSRGKRRSGADGKRRSRADAMHCVPTLILLFLASLIAGCGDGGDQADIPYPIIPKPKLVEPGQGSFTLTDDTPIWVSGSNADSLEQVATYISDWLEETRDIELDLHAQGNGISLSLDPGVTGEEGYVLDVSRSGVELRAATARGLFYAAQSLLQLIPPSGLSNEIEVPAVHIQDEPRFAYRGLMLDVGRHFFPVEFIKKYIDLLAQYKLNRFHWHLTEDQGWRIEIKRYPKLQEVAAYRPETLIGHYNDQPQQFDGERYGGYYTQEEVKEVVSYAQERFVTIIPEIEMPGHAQAAIAAYPELGCTGETMQPATLWGVHENIFCPSEETFAFLEGVLTEVMELFPSKYIHIGGDEAPKTQWEESALAQRVIRREGLEDEHGLQSYFIGRIEKFLNDHGRQIIGWDEILEGGLAPNATVMSWRGTSGGIEAARQGHDVIMTPTTHLYFDYYQSDSPDEPLAIGGYLPIDKVYSFEPVPEELSQEESRYVLGAQANLWTEYIDSPEKVEYMVYPRALALAELAWTPAEEKDFQDFAERLSVHIPRLQGMGVHAANKLYDLAHHIEAGDGNGVRVSFSNLVHAGDIRYTMDGSEPGPGSPRAEGPVRIDQSGEVRARTFLHGKPAGRGTSIRFDMHLGAGSAITLRNEPAPQYSAGGEGAVLNGVFGNEERYGDSEWLGFNGEDLYAEIDLGESKELSGIDFRFFNGPGQWIYPPRRVRVERSEDGDTFREVGSMELEEDYPGKIVNIGLDLEAGSGRYLRVIAENFGEIPAGRQGGGHPAWLFVDELVIR